MSIKKSMSFLIALTMVFGSGASIAAAAQSIYPQSAVSSTGALRWPAYEKLTPNATLKEFQQRIAEWEGCDYDDCIMLSDKDFLTPTKPYHINKSRKGALRVTLTEGTELTKEDIVSRWIELLRAKGEPEKVMAKAEDDLNGFVDITKNDDGTYDVDSVRHLSYYSISFEDVLETFDNVEKIEAKFSYNTHSRVNSTGGYSIFFNCDHKISTEDFPEGLGVKSVAKREDMGGCYEFKLESTDYRDYYEYSPFLLALGVSDVWLGYYTTELADTRPEAYISSPDWDTVYEKGVSLKPQIIKNKEVKNTPSNETLKEFQQRIAGWEDADYDDCIMLSDNSFLTPSKPYEIHKLRMTSYRVFLRKGTTLDKDEVLEKWENVLRENGYPESSLQYFTVDITEADKGAYYVSTTQEAYKDVSFLDILKSFDNVELIDAQFGYHTDSRPNYTSDYVLYFNWNGNTRLTEKDIEGKFGIDSLEFRLDTPEAYALKLKSDEYSDYFAMASFLLKLGAKDLKLGYVSTELADGSDDAFITFPEWTVLYENENAGEPEKKLLPEYQALVPDNDTLREFQERIAGWEGADYDDCIMLSATQFLTPKKLYDIQSIRQTRYRVTLREGTLLSESDLLAKWTDILRENGYPDSSLKYLKAEITDAGDGKYYVSVPAQEGYKGISILDVLRSYDNVEYIDAKFGYHTDSRPNSTGGYAFGFYTNKDYTVDDFGKDSGVSEVRRRSDNEVYMDLSRYYEVVLDSTDYKAYFDFAPTLLARDDIWGLTLNGYTTCLADANEDASITSPDWVKLYQRAETPELGSVIVNVYDSETGELFDAEDITFSIVGGKKVTAGSDAQPAGAILVGSWHSSAANPFVLNNIETIEPDWTFSVNGALPSNKEYYYTFDEERSERTFSFADGTAQTVDIYLKKNYVDNSDTDNNGTDVRSSVSGDVNCDGKFSVADIVIVQRYLVFNTFPNNSNIMNADLNSDGKVNISDLARLKRSMMK